MKMNNSIFLLFVFCLILSCSNESKIELPITEKKGFGPFKSLGMSTISTYLEDDNNPWAKPYLSATGIPKNWRDIKKGGITIDPHQLTYQHYKLGYITKEKYESLNKFSYWVPDTMNLPKETLKNKIAFAYGKDSTGTTRMIIDTNNNFDFSDDKIFTPIEQNLNINKDSLAMNHSVLVEYERYMGNNAVKLSAPLLIMHSSDDNKILYTFSQYATAQIHGVEIAIRPDNFRNLCYGAADIVLMDDSLRSGAKAKNENIISQNEYINIKGKIFKYIGVNLNRNVLTLEKSDLSQNQLYSSQVGFKSLPFKGIDFTTNDSINSDNLIGKYVLLDFWAVWCGPCKDEMPNIKSLYEKIDKSKFEIIGIVEESPSSELKKIIEEQKINWTQIQSDDSNKIREIYGIYSYPTTFLINPDGIIVAKNLRGKELEDKLISLIK